MPDQIPATPMNTPCNDTYYRLCNPKVSCEPRSGDVKNDPKVCGPAPTASTPQTPANYTSANPVKDLGRMVSGGK